MKRKLFNGGRYVAAGIVAFGIQGVILNSNVAQAANGVWIGDGSAGGADGGSWTTTPTKWSSSVIADGSGNSADFSTIDITANTGISLDASRTIGSLSFADTDPATAFNWTISNGVSGTNILTLAGGSTPSITVGTLGSGKNVTIAAALGGNQGFTKLGAGLLILSGNNTTTGGYSGTTTVSVGTLQLNSDNAIGSGSVSIASGAVLSFDSVSVNFSGSTSGNGKIIKTNSASLVTLSGNGTHAGGTQLSDGTIAIGTGTNFGLGTGTLTINGGRFQSVDNNSRLVANVLSLGGSNGIAFGAAEGASTGWGDLTFGDISNISIGASRTWTVNNATTATFNNGFTGNGTWNVTKAGNGSLVFNGSIITGNSVGVVVNGGTMTLNGGSNAYTGNTSVTAGTLIVNGVKSSSTGTVSVSSGATLAGKGSVAGAATVNGNLSPGSTSGAYGTLTLTGATALSSTSILAFDLNAANQSIGGTANDLLSLTSTGAFNLDGTLNVTSSALGLGTWRLINYSGTLTDNVLSIGTLSLAANEEAKIVAAGGHVDLVVTQIPEPATLGLLSLGGVSLLARRRRSAGSASSI